MWVARVGGPCLFERQALYLLTPRTFEGWLKGVLTFSRFILIPLQPTGVERQDP